MCFAGHESRNFFPELDWWDKTAGIEWGGKLIPTQTGKHAIAIALGLFDLDKHCEVLITTSTGNRYVSKCVTQTIEKFCQWSHQRSKNTRLVYVIHDFGLPPAADSLEDYYPVIEDCAYGFFAPFIVEGFARRRSLKIFSLPKITDVGAGGFLAIPEFERCVDGLDLEKCFLPLESVFRETVENFEAIRRKRTENLDYFATKLKRYALSPYFTLSDCPVPAVCLLKTGGDGKLDNLKIYLNNHGIESSVFYGKNAFFFPVHQNLSDVEKDYIFRVISYYFENGGANG